MKANLAPQASPPSPSSQPDGREDGGEEGDDPEGSHNSFRAQVKRSENHLLKRDSHFLSSPIQSRRKTPASRNCPLYRKFVAMKRALSNDHYKGSRIPLVPIRRVRSLASAAPCGCSVSPLRSAGTFAFEAPNEDSKFFQQRARLTLWLH